MIRTSLVTLVFLTGCFDSLLGSPCKPGYTTEAGKCVIDHGTLPPDAVVTVSPDGGGPDTGPVTPPDAGPDAPVPPDAPTCVADLQTDPDNCGACGHTCQSGICSAGACEGDPRGHVIAIGHDYTSANPPMIRLLGNSAALGEHAELTVARWSTPSPAVTSALASGLASVGRSLHTVPIPAMPSANAFDGIDVIVVDPNSAADGTTEAAKGLAWRSAFTTFLLRGGVVIVLEGTGGTNFQLADGADLYHTVAPVTVTGTHLQVVAGADAIAQQVISPYLAASNSVAYPTLPSVVSAPTLGAVVYHQTRP